MKGLSIGRETAGADLVAGLVDAVTSIPDALGSAVLAGLNPIHGLYAIMVGTPVGALTTGSVLMNVSITSAMALAVGEALVATTFIGVLERYAKRLRSRGGKLILSGVSEAVWQRLLATETTDSIPEEDVFLADDILGASTLRAMEAARDWLEQAVEEDS